MPDATADPATRRPEADAILTATVPSPIGPLTLTAVGGRLTGLLMAGQAHGPRDRSGWVEDPDALAGVARQLRAYFAGERRMFDVALDLRGTPFQQRVWAEILRIPFGETRSYSQVAAAAGSPGASRAVGLATGRNPVAVIVPCHRVVGADGNLTGFGGGLARKSWLLALERRDGTLPLPPG